MFIFYTLHIHCICNWGFETVCKLSEKYNYSKTISYVFQPKKNNLQKKIPFADSYKNGNNNWREIHFTHFKHRDVFRISIIFQESKENPPDYWQMFRSWNKLKTHSLVILVFCIRFKHAKFYINRLFLDCLLIIMNLFPNIIQRKHTH